MKVKLLNDGGYDGLEDIDFPIVVQARNSVSDLMVEVAGSELSTAGAAISIFNDDLDYCFLIGSEAEVI